MNRTTISLFWQFIDRFSVQGIQFLIGIVLSRLLSPNDYGIIGIIMVFFTFCDIFVDSGFGKGLIQKTDRTDIDSSTVFFFNIVVCFCCICRAAVDYIMGIDNRKSSVWNKDTAQKRKKAYI